MSGKCILFVLGMGRSGTSALTRVLSLCGCALPTLLVGGDDNNPKGHWEPFEASKLNNEFLFQHNTTWLDPSLRLQEEMTFQDAEEDAYVHAIQMFLKGYSAGATPLVIKDPKITALFRFWLEAARREDYGAKVVIIIRHPEEVAASLAVPGVSPELAVAMWIKYNLLAERQSRDLPRVFIEYSALLSGWRLQVERISSALGMDLQAHDDASIDSFLTETLYRNRRSGPINEVFGNSWISTTYTILSAAARGAPFELAALDELYRCYYACERAFRTSVEDFHSNWNPAKIRKITDGLIPWTGGRDF